MPWMDWGAGPPDTPAGARVYFAETKDLGKTPKKRQRYVHGRLRALGFQVFVPDSKPAVDAMLACILEEDSV